MRIAFSSVVALFLVACGTAEPEFLHSGGGVPIEVVPPVVRAPVLAIERNGLENAWLVAPMLYRGAQPDTEGFRELQRLGVRTVVNLRQFHSDRDKIHEAELSTELGYEHIRIATWSPSQAQVLRFLQIATDPEQQPVFVHCMHGSDRTGMMIAAYRIVVQGWTKDEAIAEMTEGGFGYHTIWAGLPKLLRALDVQAFRRELGITATQN